VKILIQAGKAVSTAEVGRLIAKVLDKEGYTVLLHRQYPTFYRLDRICDGLIIINPISPIWSLTYFNMFLKAKNELKGNVVFYGIADGIPKRIMFPDWVFKYVEIIANSKFSKKCLEKAGFKVIDVIPHAVDFEEVEIAQKLAEEYRKKIRNQFGDKVVFGFLSNDLPRKGIDEFIQACDELYSKFKDFVVLVISKETIKARLAGKEWAYFVSSFGSRDHVEIMGFLGAIDYLIYTAKCDSFGLPILEANAMGTPVIHVKSEPYIEFTDEKANVMFKYEREVTKDLGEGIDYIFHEYDITELVNAIEYAIDIYYNKRDEYEDRKTKAQEKAREFDIYKIYSKFTKYFKKKE